MTQLSSRKRRRQFSQKFEPLEARTLLSANISSYVLANVAPNSAAYDSAGNLWVLNSLDGTLDEINTTAGSQSIAKTIPFDTRNYQPSGIVAGLNGMIYAIDGIGANNFGAIDAINTSTGAISKIFQGTSEADLPAAIAVTGSGAIWFVGGSQEFGPGGDVIGRIDPTTHTVTETPSAATPASTDAYGFTLAASGTDSVWVAFDATFAQDAAPGHNYIISASFSSNAVQVNGTYPVNTGNAAADQNNFISSIIDGGDGTVWFTLEGGQNSSSVADEIVQGSVLGSTLVQTASPPVPGATADAPVGISGLNFDAQNNLWFVEQNGSQFGYLDSTGSFKTYNTADYTDGQPFQMVANPAGTQLSIMTYQGASDAGGPIIQIDEPQATVPFSFTSVSTLNTVQGNDINGTLLATFTGPTPTNGYKATITWSDNTTSSGIIQSLGGNDWAVLAPSKSFTVAGANLSATLTVTDGSTSHNTTVKYTVSAIPLDATSLTVSPLLLRIVLLTGTFTNDGNIPMSTVSATINWGDGTTSTGLIVRDPTNPDDYFVLALHQYRTKGKYTVKLTVSTTDTLAETLTSSITSTVLAR